MTKQPLVLTTRIESGAQIAIGAIASVTANRARLPIPPPIATRKYLLIRKIQGRRGYPKKQMKPQKQRKPASRPVQLRPLLPGARCKAAKATTDSPIIDF